MTRRESLGWMVAGALAIVFVVRVTAERGSVRKSAAEAARTAAPGGDAPRNAPAPPKPPAVRGTVIDARDGTPIERARVVLRAAGGGGGTWVVTDTSSVGTFDVPLGRDGLAADADVEARVRATGFVDWRGMGSAAAPIEVRLQPRVAEPLPGRIAGVALDLDGRPFVGEIGVRGFDEFLEPMRRAAHADLEGRFLLEGVPPGTWTVSLGEDDLAADVVVAANATATCTFRSRLRATFEPASTGVAAIDAEISDLDSRAETLRRSAAATASSAVAEELARQVAAIERTRAALLRERARALPHREVVIRGLPATERAWVVIPGDLGDWVVEAREGEARFPPIGVGPTRAEVRRPGTPAAYVAIRVVAGAGPQVVDADMK